MAEPFSTAASAFAVVGVVDVVLRASIECCRFLSKIKDAPAEIDRLRTCIKENTQLIETLKKHLDRLRDPTSSVVWSTTELSSTFDGFNSSVRALHRELNALQTLAKKHGSADTTWARVKWVLDGRKMSKSLEKLERSKSTLSVALSLVEGRQSAFNQKSVENSIQQNFQQLRSTMDSKLQELSIITANQVKVLEGQEKVIIHSTQKSSLIQKDLLKAARICQTENDKTRGEVTDGNQKVINTITSKLEELRMAIPKSRAVARNINREICFIGASREPVLASLLLIKDYIQWATLHLVSHHAEQASPRLLYFLRSEFDSLVISAIQESAASCQGSTATSTDQWIYSTRSDTRYNTAVPPVTPILRGSSKLSKRAKAESYSSAPRKRFFFRFKNWSFSSPVGKLRLTIPCNSEDENVSCNVDEASFSFVPSAGISSYATSARFVKFMNSKLEPRLYTQLNAFRLVEDWDVHLELFTDGSIKEIDAAFRNGTISPYDYWNDGDTCWIAGRNARREVLEYLDNQGIGILALNGELNALKGFGDSIQCGPGECIPYNDLIDVQAYFEDNITTCVVTPNTSLLHMSVSGSISYPEEYSWLIKTWMGFLKRNDYNFELQDEGGKTPLLDHVGGKGERSLSIVRLLLEFGVNPHALDPYGRNAIQIAMSSIAKYKDSYKDLEILEEKLSLLIKRGASPRHRDEEVWCRVLVQNGMTIDEVLEEGEEWLLKESGVGDTMMKNPAIENSDIEMQE